MQYCLLMHYQEGPEIGLTEEDMAPARAAFARYADDLDAAGVLIGTQVLQPAAASTTFTARDGGPGRPVRRYQGASGRGVRDRCARL